jgi:hypothetical protein
MTSSFVGDAGTGIQGCEFSSKTFLSEFGQIPEARYKS